jgi:arginine decarboxylase-like protein
MHDVHVLDLAELETGTGLELAAMVDELRARAARGPLIVRNCPQMLAHTLYKAGLLRSGHIVLESVRDEEPYG